MLPAISKNNKIEKGGKEQGESKCNGSAKYVYIEIMAPNSPVQPKQTCISRLFSQDLGLLLSNKFCSVFVGS